MSKAGKALKKILEAYNISQNKLAVTMGTTRANVGRWFHGKGDPSGDAVVSIVMALRQINPEAAKEFVKLYLNESLEDEPLREPKSKLERLRIKAGVTQLQVAEALGVYLETVRNWEAGLAEPQLTVSQMRNLLEILQCSWEELPDSLGS